MHHSPECICRNFGVRAQCASRHSFICIRSVYPGVRCNMHHSPECVCRNSRVSAHDAIHSLECDLSSRCVFWSEDAIGITHQEYLQEFLSEGALHQSPECDFAIRTVYSGVRMQHASLAKVYLRDSGVRARCASRQSVFCIRSVYSGAGMQCISGQSVLVGILE